MRKRRAFTREFKREATTMVLDQGFSFTQVSLHLEMGENSLRRWAQQVQFERNGGVPETEALTDEQREIQRLKARTNTKKSYSALGVGRDQSIKLIDRLRAHETVERLCRALDVCRSSYYAAKKRKNVIDVERLLQRAKLRELFDDSRGSAGSRTLTLQMNDSGIPIGRFKVRRIMAEASLMSRQPGHKYKKTGQARVDIPNHLDRQFDVDRPNKVWCGDITYVWAGDHWSYLAVVIDLHARRVVGWALANKPNA